MPRNYKKYYNNCNSDLLSIPRRTKTRFIRNKQIINTSQADYSVLTCNEDFTTPQNSSNCQERIIKDPNSNDNHPGEGPNEREFLGFKNHPELTKKEIGFLIFAYTLRHNLTKNSISDLLQLLRFILPSNISVPSSVYGLEKLISIKYDLLNKHFLCKSCKIYLGTESTFDGKLCLTCEGAKTAYKEEDYNFFYTIDMKTSLKVILEDAAVQCAIQNTCEKRNENRDYLEDIYDGIKYKRMGLKNYDLSLTANTDGVPVFKSSKVSVWPIIISLNEIPYAMRRKHVIMAQLWIGDKKPPFESFLEPFVNEMKSLSVEGIQWTMGGKFVTSKIYVSQFVADSSARCIVQGLKQFNGAHSCTWCEAKGQNWTSNTNKNSRKWIFPASNALTSQKRTHFNFLTRIKEFSTLLANTKHATLTDHFGIKSASKLLLLHKFDIVDSLTFDYMHTILLGITRTLTFAWLNPANHNLPFYIGKHAKKIDEILTKILVPFETSRATRSIMERRFWKASEWKTWLFTSPLVLYNILPRQYFTHFTKLTFAVHMMCQSRITVTDIQKAKNLIHEFTNGIEVLYGLSYCSYNIHLLTHMCDCVHNWGPLWCYSAFQFEHFNGILLNSFHGTQKVSLQMSKKVCDVAQAWQMGINQFHSKSTENFYFCLLESKTYVGKTCLFGGHSFCGNGKQYIFNVNEQKHIANLGFQVKFGLSYNTCIINGTKYHSKSKVSKNRYNSILYANGNLYVVRTFVCVKLNKREGAFAIGYKLNVRSEKKFRPMYNVISTREFLTILNLNEVTPKKYFCNFNKTNNQFLSLVELPNIIEVE